MRRKYADCQRQDGDCTQCSLVNYGRDCRNNKITNLEWHRLASQISQKDLAEAAGMNVRQIQRIENGEGSMGNVTLSNALALAKALGVSPEELI